MFVVFLLIINIYSHILLLKNKINSYLYKKKKIMNVY